MYSNETLSSTNRASANATADVKETVVKGRSTRLKTIAVDGKTLVVTGRFIRTARLEDEWYDDLESPASIVEALRKSNPGADVLTFWQRLPDTTARYEYHHEWESVAAVPIETYDRWWNKQINGKARNLLRKSAKLGVVVKEAAFDDAFIAGMTEIFNETPSRQHRPFWHYGKSADTIKREFSRNLFREQLFGAYLDDALIGIMFLADAGKYGVLGQIISKVQQRDKAPTNALIAKAVEVCAGKGVPYLVYEKWVDGTLGHFKQQNGFERFDLPRYYVPLTLKGKLILRLGLQHGLVGAIPPRLRAPLIRLRNRLHSALSASSKTQSANAS